MKRRGLSQGAVGRMIGMDRRNVNKNFVWNEKIYFVMKYDFDTTSPAGKAFMIIIMALAQFERVLTTERIKNNFHARALRGL